MKKSWLKEEFNEKTNANKFNYKVKSKTRKQDKRK